MATWLLGRCRVMPSYLSTVKDWCLWGIDSLNPQFMLEKFQKQNCRQKFPKRLQNLRCKFVKFLKVPLNFVKSDLLIFLPVFLVIFLRDPFFFWYSNSCFCFLIAIWTYSLGIGCSSHPFPRPNKHELAQLLKAFCRCVLLTRLFIQYFSIDWLPFHSESVCRIQR